MGCSGQLSDWHHKGGEVRHAKDLRSMGTYGAAGQTGTTLGGKVRGKETAIPQWCPAPEQGFMLEALKLPHTGKKALDVP